MRGLPELGCDALQFGHHVLLQPVLLLNVLLFQLIDPLFVLVLDGLHPLLLVLVLGHELLPLNAKLLQRVQFLREHHVLGDELLLRSGKVGLHRGQLGLVPLSLARVHLLQPLEPRLQLRDLVRPLLQRPLQVGHHVGLVLPQLLVALLVLIVGDLQAAELLQPPGELLLEALDLDLVPLLVDLAHLLLLVVASALRLRLRFLRLLHHFGALELFPPLDDKNFICDGEIQAQPVDEEYCCGTKQHSGLKEFS